MVGVAVGWRIYALTHTTFALGMVGLVQFLPMPLLVLLVGHVADRFDRKTIISICQIIEGLTLASLAVANRLGNCSESLQRISARISLAKRRSLRSEVSPAHRYSAGPRQV
jgi:MFS family permease